MNNSKSEIRSGIILNYINLILGNLIPVFYTPIMLKLLGQGEYGLYKLSSNVVSYLSLISLGIGSAVTRYLIKARSENGQEEEERVLGLFTLIFAAISILTLLIGSFLAFHIDIWYRNSLTTAELTRMKILVFIMVINTVITFVFTPCSAVPGAHEKFVFVQGTNIVSTCVGPIVNLVVLFLGYKSVSLAICSLVMQISLRIVYLFFVRSRMKIKISFHNMPLHLLREILTFSFWVFVSNVVGQLYNATDIAMIGAVPALATTGVAVYNIGATFNTIELGITTGVSNLLAARTNKMVFSGASTHELSDLMIRAGRIQAYIITLIISGFIAFGQPFLLFYAGEGYEDAYWVAILLMVPNMIPLLESLCLTIIIAENRHRFRSLVYLFIAISNVIGTWILLQYKGIVGAAAMTAISVLIGHGMIMNWYYYKKIGLDIPRFWKEIFKIMIIPVVMCVVTVSISVVVNFYSVLVLLSGIIIYTVLFCVLNWRFVMNSYEKEIVTQLISPVLFRKD